MPKTLIFCKDDAHAESVVTLAREVFGRGNDFAVKITYSARQPRELIKAFRTSMGSLVGEAVLGVDAEVVAAAEALAAARQQDHMYGGVEVGALDGVREVPRGVGGDGVATLGPVKVRRATRSSTS